MHDFFFINMKTSQNLKILMSNLDSCIRYFVASYYGNIHNLKANRIFTGKPLLYIYSV